MVIRRGKAHPEAMAPSPNSRRPGYLRSNALIRDGLFGLIIVAIGWSFALSVVGWRVINPLDDSWFAGDPAQGYLGWLLFRNEEHLSFPLGFTKALAYPLGDPIAYFDSLPLVALIFWPFRHVLPEHFQYHGIVFVLQCILQLYFGYRVTLRLSGNDRICAFFGGLLFMMAPAFVWRAFGHFALASHWLILAALEFFLTAKEKALPWRTVQSATLGFIAGGVNPYITAVTLLIVAAAYARPIFETDDLRSELKTSVASSIGFGISVAIALGSLLLFGFIVLNDPDIYAGGGYGYYSMNLLSPIDPRQYSALLLREQASLAGQYEGYNYIGLGVLLLGVVSLSYRPGMARLLFRKKNIPALCVVGISLLLALSLKATVGGAIIYELSVPERVLKLLSAFRASGRLFWPAYYFILVCVLSGAILAYGKRAWIMIGLAAAVQVADLRGLNTEIHRQWKWSSAKAFTDEPSWQEVGRTHRNLMVIPPYQCDPSRTPGGQAAGFWIFGKLAAQHGMTINSFYAGRTSPKQIDFFCNAQVSTLLRDGLQRDTAYVFSTPNFPLSLHLQDHFCRIQNGLILCAVGTEKQGFDRAVVETLPIAPLGETIGFQSIVDPNGKFLGVGWSAPESWGRWSEGQEATLGFRVPGEKSLKVRLELTPFAPPNHPQRVALFADGQSVGEWRFDAHKEETLLIDLPSETARKGYVILKFSLPDAVSPAALGLSEDTRRLGVGLVSLRVDEE